MTIKPTKARKLEIERFTADPHRAIAKWIGEADQAGSLHGLLNLYHHLQAEVHYWYNICVAGGQAIHDPYMGQPMSPSAARTVRKTYAHDRKYLGAPDPVLALNVAYLRLAIAGVVLVKKSMETNALLWPEGSKKRQEETLALKERIIGCSEIERLNRIVNECAPVYACAGSCFPKNAAPALVDGFIEHIFRMRALLGRFPDAENMLQLLTGEFSAQVKPLAPLSLAQAAGAETLPYAIEARARHARTM